MQMTMQLNRKSRVILNLLSLKSPLLSKVLDSGQQWPLGKPWKKQFYSSFSLAEVKAKEVNDSNVFILERTDWNMALNIVGLGLAWQNQSES